MGTTHRRRGIVWIAPAAMEIPSGRMVDPATSWFWVSWQNDDPEGLIDDKDLLGAETAIAGGLERAETVYIRLSHGHTYFLAGIPSGRATEMDESPPWPPTGAPPEGWWRPDPNDHR